MEEKKTNAFTEEKELLRQQLRLLAKQSKTAYEKDLAELSDSMCKVYKLLFQTEFAVIAQFAVPAYLFVGFLILFKKLLRGKV